MANATMPSASRKMPIPTWALPILLVSLLLAAIVGSLGFGAYPMSFGRAFNVLLHVLWPFSSPDHQAFDLREISVIEVIRPPRILVATFVGVALGLSGTALQGMMRNPLIGPDLVGVSSGAAFGGVLAIALGYSSAGLVALAFIFGLVAVTCTFTLANFVHAKSDSIALILAGFFVGSFFLAGVGLLLFTDQNGRGIGIIYWLLGTFRGADLTKVWMIVPPTLFGGAILIALRWRINLLSLGELDAASLGINTRTLRWMIIAVVTLMVAAQVAVAGIVGWVGLIVPHCARMLVGPDHRRLLPVAALLGGLFTLGLDDLTRTIVHAEIPVSVLTAFVGTPIMFFLFWKTQCKGWAKD